MSDLDLRYDFLDGLPQRLFDAVVNHPHGSLKPRTHAIVELRAALLSGRVPQKLAWPEGALQTVLLEGLELSGIASVCDADPTLTDDVILAVLDASEEAQRQLDSLMGELREKAIAGARRTVGLRPGDHGETLIDELTWQKIRIEAERLAAETMAESLSAKMEQDWGPDLRDWAEVRRILDDLADTVGEPTDRLLKLIDWRKSTQLRKILGKLPVLRALIRSLGRGRDGDGQPPELQQLKGPVVRTVERMEWVREIGQVEIRGVERSDELARMLPSEALLRRHPLLKWLWHARRAERALLTYHADSVYTQRIQTEQGYSDGMEEVKPRAERGPVIVILDTSASMRGEPEALAKAVVLQILCSTHLEKRACYVYNFSGAGRLAERELSLEADGLADALAFLSVSFHDDTNIEAALRRAVEQLADEKWASSDIVIVSDGLWTKRDGRYDSSLVHTVKQAQEQHRVRVHAALTLPLFPPGNHELFDESTRERYTYVDPHGMVRALCDPIHDLCAWIEQLRPNN